MTDVQAAEFVLRTLRHREAEWLSARGACGRIDWSTMHDAVFEESRGGYEFCEVPEYTEAPTDNVQGNGS